MGHHIFEKSSPRPEKLDALWLRASFDGLGDSMQLRGGACSSARVCIVEWGRLVHVSRFQRNLTNNIVIVITWSGFDFKKQTL